jgi:hypothetical protein
MTRRVAYGRPFIFGLGRVGMIFFSGGAGGCGTPAVIRYWRVGTVVQQRDTSGCVTTPAHIEKQRPTVPRNWNPSISVSLRCYPCAFLGCVRSLTCI